MTVWLAATIGLLPAFAIALWVAMRGDVNNRLVALQFATGLTALMLAMMTFAFDQPSFIDLALALTLLGVPSTYLLATFYERWL